MRYLKYFFLFVILVNFCTGEPVAINLKVTSSDAKLEQVTIKTLMGIKGSNYTLYLDHPQPEFTVYVVVAAAGNTVGFASTLSYHVKLDTVDAYLKTQNPALSEQLRGLGEVTVYRTLYLTDFLQHQIQATLNTIMSLYYKEVISYYVK